MFQEGSYHHLSMSSPSKSSPLCWPWKDSKPGHCSSGLGQLIPTRRCILSITSAPVPKELGLMAGRDTCYPSAMGCTQSWQLILAATFDTAVETCCNLAPDFWKQITFIQSPCQEYSGIYYLIANHTRISMKRTKAAA